MKNNKTNFQYEEQILHYSINDIVARCFERYAKYIILERALPDVRDGLKPVQRRILYAMYDLGLTSDKAYKKAARVVGEVIGKYHPHGDSAVYAAMCRMAQEWKVTSPLVEMQGNKGSIDGDSPAAMRYTEARLSEIAQLLLNDIKKNTVIFTKNFDDSETEPVVLPGYFPNLLVNGAAGIAVGMATNIPPHNLGEVINALIIRITNPNVTCKEIMQTALKGPDFPTGGIIQGLKGIKEAYYTGKGRIAIRAKTAIQRQGKVYQIIISELPFEVIKQELIKKIDDVREAQTIYGIKEIRDETDRFGLRIVIDLGSDAKAEEILNYLFKNTTLQIYYNFNLVAIANKKPVQMTLLEMLDFYISHQIIITTKRITYELTHLEKRLEIVKGLVLVLEHVTKVISIIRSAEDRISAKVALIAAFNFTENQAEAIVQLRLYRLSATDVTNLKLEQIDINAKIKMKNRILADEKLLREVIIKKLIAMKENYALPRKSEITGEIIEIKIDEKATMRQEEVFISVSHDGWIKVINNKLVSQNVNYQDFGRKPNDVIIATTIVNNFANLLLFTNKGNYFILPIFKFEEQRWKDNGLHVNTMCKIGTDEKIINMMEITNFEEISANLILVTQQGLIKRILFSSLVTTKLTKISRYTKLKEKDSVVNISICTDYDFIVVSTKKGFTLKYLASKVPLLSKTSFGVKALKMENIDEIVGMATGNSNDIYGILTTTGTLKRLLFNNIEQTVRTTKGNKILKAVKSANIKIVKTFLCSDDVLINVLTNKEKWIVITAKEVPLTRVKEGIGKAISEDIILAGTNLGLKLNNKHFTVLPLIIPNKLLETN